MSKALLIIVVVLVLAGGGWWGYSYLENQKVEQAQAQARAAAQKKAAEATQRTSEDEKMAEDLKRQKVAADEALRRAQEDRDRAAAELEAFKASQARWKRSK